MVADEDAIAKVFNNCFSSIGFNISHNVPGSRKTFDRYLPHHNANIYFDPMDVMNVAMKLKPKTSFGSDGVSSKLLIQTINQIVYHITHIINLSLETVYFQMS